MRPLACAKSHGEYEAAEHCSRRSGGTISGAPSPIRGWSDLVMVGVHHAPVFSGVASHGLLQIECVKPAVAERSQSGAETDLT